VACPWIWPVVAARERGGEASRARVRFALLAPTSPVGERSPPTDVTRGVIRALGQLGRVEAGKCTLSTITIIKILLLFSNIYYTLIYF
jgi:hypothetical protein